MHMRKLLEQIL